MLRALGLIAAVILLAGCSVAQPEPEQPQASTASEAPTDTQSPVPEDSSNAEPEGPVDCPASLQQDIEATIKSQTSAFSVDDFELAYSFASENFQRSVTLNEFVLIINNSYGPLIASTDLVFTDCLASVDQSVGLISVRFLEQSNAVYGLQYLMVNTDSGWKVEGASNLSVSGEGA